MLLLSLFILPLGLSLAASPEPCALVTKISNQALKRNSSKIEIPGQLALECLQSIPFYTNRAEGFLEQLDKYVQFQSTLEALVDPPETYTSSATDILGGLEKIRETKYSSQYEFDLAISRLFQTANDGHFHISTCSLGIFQFKRQNVSLVSVSTDGLEEPELYTYADAKYLNSSDVKVSPIVSINGEDAGSYLEGVADNIGSQDPDSRYNQLFYSFAYLAAGYDSPSGGFISHDNIYPGSNVTTIEFRNGSSIELETVAILGSNDFAAKDGKDVFDAYCLPAEPSSDSSELTSRSDAAESTEAEVNPPLKSGPVGYPEPFIRDSYNQINGYLLDDDETAVMYISSFLSGEGLPADQNAVFARTATELVSRARAAGRTKMIIDVSANGGGQITRAFDLFKLFFPSEFPYSATRFRRHVTSEGMVKIFQWMNRTQALQNGGPLGHASQVTPDQESGFESYQDFLGDTTQLGAKVNSLYANFNYSDSSPEAPIRGYGGSRLNATQPFKAENILIIGDGVCASTCTTFVNLMTNVGGVRALPFGGRPNGKPMQLMGGVRGAQFVSFDNILSFSKGVQTILSQVVGPDGTFSFLEPGEFEKIRAAIPRPFSEFPLRLGGGGVNLRNAYQEGDDDLPLQFQYQAGDCRLYYTAENIYHPETVWESAKEAIWGNGSCVKGSTGGQGSLEDKEKGGKGSDGEGEEGEEGEDGDGEEGGEGEESEGEGERSGAAGVTVGWGMLVVALAMAAFF